MQLQREQHEQRQHELRRQEQLLQQLPYLCSVTGATQAHTGTEGATEAQTQKVTRAAAAGAAEAWAAATWASGP